MTHLQVLGADLMVYTAAISFIISCTSSTCASCTQRHFQLQRKPRRGQVRLGKPWVDKSRKSCAKTCMQKYKNYTSFLFNSLSRLCTPSSFVNEKQPLPSSAEGDFFQSFYCDTSKGFGVKTYGNTVACVGLFGRATYTEADANCQSKSAYLMSVKTLEKYNILVRNVSNNVTVWVGCDDLVQEGTFIWKEDGQMLTDTERISLFLQGDPNDSGGDEDCTIYSPKKSGLLDARCTNSNYYACEMPYR